MPALGTAVSESRALLGSSYDRQMTGGLRESDPKSHARPVPSWLQKLPPCVHVARGQLLLATSTSKLPLAATPGQTLIWEQWLLPLETLPRRGIFHPRSSLVQSCVPARECVLGGGGGISDPPGAPQTQRQSQPICTRGRTT